MSIQRLCSVAMFLDSGTNMAASLRAFRAEHYLRRSNWLKHAAWIIGYTKPSVQRLIRCKLVDVRIHCWLNYALHPNDNSVVCAARFNVVHFGTYVQVFETDHDVVADGYRYIDPRAKHLDRRQRVAIKQGALDVTWQPPKTNVSQSRPCEVKSGQVKSNQTGHVKSNPVKLNQIR